MTSQPGLYCPQEMIDFGLVPSDSGPQTLELLLINSGRTPLTVSSVVATPVTENLNIEFSSVKIPPDTIRPSVISRVTFDPSLATSDGKQEGKLLIKSSNSKYKVSIPWQAQVLKGGLHWNSTASKFLLSDKPDPEDPSQANIISTVRPLTITNKFALPVVVYSIKMADEAKKFFDLSPFQPTVIKAGESVDLLTISVKAEAWQGDRKLDSFLTLDTNLTSVNIPLVAFDGKLKPVCQILRARSVSHYILLPVFSFITGGICFGFRHRRYEREERLVLCSDKQRPSQGCVARLGRKHYR